MEEIVIRTVSEILSDLGQKYRQPQMKLRQMTLRGEITQVIRGLYETDKNTPGEALAGAIYGPSYLSFDYALSRHGLIPEAVHLFTSASFKKNKTKLYKTPFGEFSYSNVPPDVFPHGVNIENAEDRPYAMATCEKALCDKLYKEHPIAGKRAMETFLFENLRIEVGDFRNLDFDFIEKVAPLYRKKNLQILSKMR